MTKSKKYQDLDQHLRKQLFRRVKIALTVIIIFIGLMAFALYMEHR